MKLNKIFFFFFKETEKKKNEPNRTDTAEWNKNQGSYNDFNDGLTLRFEERKDGMES